MLKIDGPTRRSALSIMAGGITTFIPGTHVSLASDEIGHAKSMEDWMDAWMADAAREVVFATASRQEDVEQTLNEIGFTISVPEIPPLDWDAVARVIGSMFILMVSLNGAYHLLNYSLPADLISAWLIKTLGSVAMPAYSHLLDEERDQIAVMRAAGRSICAIARALQRAKSTVSRELRRNALSSGRYSPLHAAGAYQLRRRREAILEKDQKLRTFVCDRLAEGWTPEQIAGWLKAGNERGLRALGFEAIYAFIYRAARKGEFLWRYLTRRHKRRRPRRARPSRDTIKDRTSIHDRPKDIEARADIGHWEGDLIICKRTRPMLVLHERKSRVTLAARLTGKTAAETISVMLAVFGRINPALRKSITFDNDTAFAQHTLLRTMRDMATWFCDAYASWQKGGVENANGRLRRWLPRHIDIDRLSDEEIQDIVITANLTPRKCLGFKTPFQGILKELGKDVQIRFS